MKKILLLSIMIAVLLTSFGFAKSTFPDVAGTKYEDAVTSLNKNGVINGFPDGTFRPQSYVTRAELCKLLVEALDLKQYGNPISSFLDVNYSDWYYEYVKAAVDNGIIIGYNDGTFRPNNNVSYSEMITMLIRAMGEEKRKGEGQRLHCRRHGVRTAVYRAQSAFCRLFGPASRRERPL